jgi:hypothetical protein
MDAATPAASHAGIARTETWATCSSEASSVSSARTIPVSSRSRCLPIGTGDVEASGALNLYSQDQPFERTDEDIGRRYVTSASVVVANARAYARAREAIEQLQEALLSRDAIGQAKGIIQSRDGCAPDEAFDRLRVMSQHRNVKLRDLAEAVIEAPDDLVHE